MMFLIEGHVPGIGISFYHNHLLARVHYFFRLAAFAGSQIAYRYRSLGWIRISGPMSLTKNSTPPCQMELVQSGTSQTGHKMVYDQSSCESCAEWRASLTVLQLVLSYDQVKIRLSKWAGWPIGESSGQCFAIADRYPLPKCTGRASASRAKDNIETIMKILPILRAQFDLFLFTIVSHRLNSIW